MDFGEMLRVLRRRWIVATVGIVLTLIATLGAYKGWPNKYQSSAEITLIGSKSMANQAGNGGNPYVAVGNLDPVASILAGNVSSDQAVQQLRAQGVTYAFTAEVPTFAAGPFIQITVIGKEPAEVTQQLPIVMRYVEQRMTQLQQETAIPTPPNSVITTQVIVPPSTPVEGAQDQARSGGRHLRALLRRHADLHRRGGPGAAAAVWQAARGRGRGHHPDSARRDQHGCGTG